MIENPAGQSPGGAPEPHAPYATVAGTTRYRARFAHLHPDHFRQRYGLWLSSIGLGTYLPAETHPPQGETSPDSVDEAAGGYGEAVRAALTLGCNVLDTALNYRQGRSEREIGAALRGLIAEGCILRDEVLVCSKGGYLSPLGASPDAASLNAEAQRIVAAGLARADEIAGTPVHGLHCLAPDYLAACIGHSLENLGLDAIDVYYLHNPEFQLQATGPDEFKARIRRSFTQLEHEADAGRIRLYGVATWEGLRTDIQDRLYLPLTLLESLAREVGGEKHRFRFVQLPYNLLERGPFSTHNQPLPAASGVQNGFGPLLAVAMQLGLTVMTSATLAQGRVIERLPAQFGRGLGEWASRAQAAIQFNRSTPGVTTALVGMSSVAHVTENMAVAEAAPLAREHVFRLFQRPAAG